MRLVFTPQGWEDYQYWQGADRAVLKRVNRLLDDALRHPTEGIGKPEPLRGDLSGYWSRRIDDTNRLVYRATDAELVVIACRFHYGRES